MRYGQPLTGTPHRHYTGDEIAAANDTDLPELLEHLGYTVKRVGSCHTTAEMDSLRVWDRRTWFRYSEGKGGDAIEFLRHFEGKTFPEAVDFLLAWNGRSRDPPIHRTGPPPRRERPLFVLPPPNGDNECVRAYLYGRGIGPGIIDHFIGAGLLYEDAAYHNCVFVGRDSTGKPVFAAKRGTWGSFKGDAARSNKKIGFRLPCGPALDTVHVFESPIDLMSWLTLHRRPMSNAVALCGLYDGPLETYLRENPGIRRIFLCLDADGPGEGAAGRLKEKYGQQGYGVSYEPPPRGKDWNAYLLLIKAA